MTPCCQRHTALILFDAYDGMILYVTCLSEVQQYVFFKQNINFIQIISTENMKLLLLLIFTIIIHKYLKILLFLLLINYPISI